MIDLIQNVMNFALSFFAAGAIQTAAPVPATTALPIPHPVPGGIALVKAGYGLKAPQVTFNGTPVLTLRPSADSQWIAVVGIPLSQQAGTATIKSGNREYAFTVGNKAYPEQHLTVKKKHVNPSNEQLQRIRQESSAMSAIYSSFTQGGEWSPMAWPVNGPLSSEFGLRRFFNGEERRPHSGLDIAVPTGTPVLAPADGTVVLTGDYFFNGKTVFVDHGQGLISMFCHLDSIEVRDGEQVIAGERLARSGATGRATGPHLHWSISLNNTRINPLLMLSPAIPLAVTGEHRG